MSPPASIRRATLAGTAVALVVFATLVSGGHPAGLVERGPFTSDFFDEQAHALLDGRLDVDPDVAGIEGFRHEGRTYLYFGLVPAILRLPVAALTDGFDGRLTQLSMLAALAVALSATGRLAWRARGWRRGDADPSVRPWEPAVCGAFVMTVGLASPLLFLGSRPVVYHEVELWGTATTLVALDAVLRWWEEPIRRHLALASLAALVAFNTRASVGGGSVAALALVAGLALLWHHQPWRRLPALALAVSAPVLLYAAVNQARFDTPFSVPFEDQVLSQTDERRQATLVATDDTLFGAEFAPSALATYLRPDGVSLQRLFPWITFRESDTVVGDPVFDTLDRSASLPVVAPTLGLLAGVGLVALLRRRARDPWLAATAGAAVGLVSTVTIAFIANRYLADFTPTLVLPAALGTWVLADRLAASGTALRRLGVTALAGLTLVASAASLSLALQTQRLFLFPSNDDRRDFVALQYDLDDALRRGPPPDVLRTDVIGEPGARGTVAIVGACRGLYWSDGARWWPLELSGDGGWVLDGAVPTGRTTLLRSTAWTLSIEASPTSLQVHYEQTDGRRRDSDVIELDDRLQHQLIVTLDTVNNELLVLLDGDPALVGWLVDLRGPVAADPHWTSSARPAPLCEELAGRLGA